MTEPTKIMRDPFFLEPTYTKGLLRRTQFKMYFPAFKVMGTHGKMILSKHYFKSASKAFAYARRVHARWRRLYAAAIVQMRKEQQP